MKKIILSALAFSFAVAVNAQEIPERKTDKPVMMEKYKHPDGTKLKDLNLTDEQKEKMKAEKETFRKQMEELKKNDAITVREWRTKMETLQSEHQARMQNILTADQKARLEKIKQEGRAKNEERMKMRTGELKTHLGLSEEQAAKMETSRKEMEAKMKLIREDPSLSEEKKREALKELHEAQHENLKSILTEEQLKKLKEEQQHKPGPEKEKAKKKEVI